MARKKWVRQFEKPKGNPAAFDPEPATTVLSPYLKFGCLSPRTFYHAITDVYTGGPHTDPPESLLGQLLWREFFYTVGFATPNHDKARTTCCGFKGVMHVCVVACVTGDGLLAAREALCHGLRWSLGASTGCNPTS